MSGLPKGTLSGPRVAAYRRLGIPPNSVLSAPKCTPFFDELGGPEIVLRALRGSPDPSARAFMLVYDNPTLNARDRRLLPLEAFCVASNVCPSRLTEVAVAAIAKNRVLRGAVIAALAHPDIMRTNIAVAKTADGVTDRLTHFKMLGVTPTPKGNTTVLNVNASASAQAAAVPPSALPAPEDTIRRIVEARQRASLATGQQPALPPASATETVPMAFQPRPRDLVAIPAEFSDASDSDDSGSEED